MYPEDIETQDPAAFDKVVPLLACCWGCDQPVKHVSIQYSNDRWNTEFDGHVGFYCDEHISGTWDEDEQPFIDYTGYSISGYRNRLALEQGHKRAKARIEALYPGLPERLVTALTRYSDEEIEQYVQARRNGDKYIVLRGVRFSVV